MKVLYLPLNLPDVWQDGMTEAFEKCGVDLHVFDYYMKHNYMKESKLSVRRAFLDAVTRVKPDLIHMQLQFTDIIDPATIIEARRVSPKSIITNWTGDARDSVPANFIKTGNVVDINLISSTGQIELYKSKIRNDVKYWQIGYNPKLYYPKNSNLEYKTIFIATNYPTSNFRGYPLRLATVNHLRKIYKDDFMLYGSGWKLGERFINQRELNDEYNKAISCISISNFNDLDHYFSDRLLMCLASGRPVVCQKFPGWDSYFTDNYDIVMANGYEEIANKVQYLVDNPEIANYIGSNGARTALQEHTYYCRAKELLKLVGL